MTYARAIEFLSGRQETRWKFGLRRIEGLMANLGRPQDSFPAIHVGGTNGKGSVCAMLAEVLRSAGLRVGLYTSPHLVAPTERIQVDGNPIPDEDFGRAVGAAQAAETEEASYFELLTGAAFHYFRERRLDAAVVEVGLGGRLDATNVLDRPLLTVLTSIGLDHTDFLGDSTASIAGEKAGILKPGIPCLCGEADEEALAVIRRRAGEVGAPLKVHRPGLRTESVDWEGGSQRLRGPDGELLILGLLGRAAVCNASLVREACSLLGGRGISIDERALADGLAHARWPGRFQVVPVRGRTLILDGAHNPAAFEAFLDTWLSSPFSRGQAVFITGMLQDKDYRGMLRRLSVHAPRLVATRSDSPRSVSPEGLAAEARAAGCRDVASASSAEAALDAWLDSGVPVGVVCGSLYLVGAALAWSRRAAA